MRTHANSLLSREAGSLINRPVTFHSAFLASTHRHHCASAASVRDDRTRCTQSALATESIAGFPACEPRPLSLSPDLSGPICGGRNVATPDPGVPRVPPPHPRETATVDYLVYSTHRSKWRVELRDCDARVNGWELR